LDRESISICLKKSLQQKEETNNKTGAKYNDLLRGRITGSLSTIDNPKIASESEVELIDFRHGGSFKCERRTHTLDANGYKTTLKVVNKK